jgi:hypothetical protein
MINCPCNAQQFVYRRALGAKSSSYCIHYVEYDDDVLIMEQMKVFYCSEVVVYLKSRNVLLIQGPYAFFSQKKKNSFQDVKRSSKTLFPI